MGCNITSAINLVCKSLLFLALGLLLLGTTVVAESLSSAKPEEVGMSGERLDHIAEVVAKAMEEEETPGAVVLVGRQGKLVYERSFGYKTVSPDEDLSVETVFDMASLTKVIATATSVMILVEEGKVSLSDYVADYIPEFGKRRKSRITVLQLLTHFSGLRPDVDLDVEWQGYDKAIELACAERPIEKPGEEFIYSDINYFVLGEIVRRVSGKPLDEFAKERIFEPLGMKDTGFNPPSEMLSRIAPTEARDGTMLIGQVHDPTAFRMGGVAGHAGLFSTVHDTAIWAQMMLNGGEYNGVRILSPLGVLKMTTPQSPAGNLDWRGLGFDIETRLSTNRGDLYPVGSYGHTGFTGTSLWIDPYTESFVVLFSSRLYPKGAGSVVSLRRKVASVVAASIIDVPKEREHYFSRY